MYLSKNSLIIGSFMPITLETLARARGVLLSDHSTPCGEKKKVACVVQFSGGIEINTTSFAMYTFSLSVLIQALVIISMSGAADHGKYRKKLLLAFAFAGSGATMLFLPMNPDLLLMVALLAIIGNTCFGAANVLMNSFLPLLVRNHPSIRRLYHQDENREDAEQQDSTNRDAVVDGAPLLAQEDVPANIISSTVPKSSPELQLSTQISSYGLGIGYISAVTLQILSILLLLAMMDPTRETSLFSLKLILFLIGLWWGLFTIPSAIWLRPRPGPPLHAKHAGSWIAYLTHSWSLLFRTIMKAKQLRDISFFLAAWFLLSDALATVSATAILFAKSELGMEPAALGAISVIVTLFGILGAFAWSAVSRYFRLTPVQTLATCIALFELIPLYGLLGFLPFIRNAKVFGLQQDWEMYPIGALYGLVLGGVGAYCRALYSELIPPGSEAAFYALYAITDKGSSIFGPAIVGAITDRFGGIRPSFFFLAVLVGLPFPLLTFVDVARGRAEARKLAAREGTGAVPDAEYLSVPSEDIVDEDRDLR